MKRKQFIAAAAFAAAVASAANADNAGAISRGAGEPPAFAPAPDIASRRMVWAHYVPWHTPDNDSLTPAWYVNHPSSDVTADPYASEVRQAIGMGIDGFFMDVCVRKGSTTFGDIRRFLRAAEGTDFLVGFCLDCKTTVSNQVDQVAKILGLCAGHPNYPKIDGRPVLATYTWFDWTADEWRAIRAGLRERGVEIFLFANLNAGRLKWSVERIKEYSDTFDGGYFFSYGPGPGIAEKNRLVGGLCREWGKPFMPRMGSGYFGGWIHGRNEFFHPWYGLDGMLNQYRGSRAAHDLANWIHVTTWNDYDETTLRPCRLTPGDFTLVGAYARGWKDEPPPERANVAVNYHREELAGTMIRIEAMRLAAREKGALSLRGRLLDKDGRAVATLQEKRFAEEDWARVEWLVPSAELAETPVLTPELTLKGGRGERTARFPALFLVRGWLECPESMRVTFDDIAPVEGDLGVQWRDGVLQAKLRFEGDVAVKRAILYRNDRPIGQFAPASEGTDASGGAGGPPAEADAPAQLSLLVTGPGNWCVTVTNGTLEGAIVKSLKPSPDGKFQIKGNTAKSYQTPAWKLSTVRVSGGPGMRLAIKANKEKREFSAADFVERRIVSLGGIAFAVSQDLTLYERAPWDAAFGEATLRVFEREPQPGDAFHVRFETRDGRCSGTMPVYPFAPEKSVADANLVETYVTLDRPSGASGSKAMIDHEFLTPREKWPVQETRIVRRPASLLGIRRAFWPLGGRDGSSPLGYRANALGDRPIETGHKRLPLRMWPSGPATVAFDLRPAATNGVAQSIFRQTGWMDGISDVRLLADGRVQASIGDLGNRLTVSGRTPLRQEEWTRVDLVFDGLRLRILLDGVEDASGAMQAPIRCYGNSKVVMSSREGASDHGDGNSTAEITESPFLGRLANLEIRGSDEELASWQGRSEKRCTESTAPSR